MRGRRANGTPAFDVSAMTFDNRAQRLLMTLVIDVSSSMTGKPIARLDDALAGMAEDLRHDVNLGAIAEVAIITFGDSVTAWRGSEPVPPGTSPFVPAAHFSPPVLRAGGVTPMVDAVERAMSCVAEEKAALKRRHLQYYQPLVWLCSDGYPTGPDGYPTQDWQGLPEVIRRAEEERRFVFFTVGAGDIDTAGDEVLKQLSPDGHVRLEGCDFTRMLKLVSASAESAARGQDAATIKQFVTNRQRVIPRV